MYIVGRKHKRFEDTRFHNWSQLMVESSVSGLTHRDKVAAKSYILGSRKMLDGLAP